MLDKAGVPAMGTIAAACLLLTVQFPNVFTIRALAIVAAMAFFWTLAGKFVNNARIASAAEFLMPYSFVVYVLHGKALTIIQNIMVKVVAQAKAILLLEYFVLPIVIMGSCVVCGMIVKKCTPRLFAILTGGRI